MKSSRKEVDVAVEVGVAVDVAVDVEVAVDVAVAVAVEEIKETYAFARCLSERKWKRWGKDPSGESISLLSFQAC